MEFHVSLDGTGDLAGRIYGSLRAAVLDGRLAPGSQVPGRRQARRRLAPGPSASPLWAELRAQHRPQRQARYDFQVGTPEVDLFPFETWRRLLTATLRRSVAGRAQYTDPAGDPALRSDIAGHVGRSRSVQATAEDVTVTQGAQQALDLIGRVLIRPGSVVAMEDPGYHPSRLVFTSLGASVVGVPVDGAGIVVDALPKAAVLVYTTPSHQFPLGLPMSLGRRSELLDWADRRGAVIIEDDYDSEFRYAGRPLEPLQSLDRHGRVIYVGSFSKTLLPMLRLGFLVAAPSLTPALRTARALSDGHGDPVAQAALARFIEEGRLAAHIRKARPSTRPGRPTCWSVSGPGSGTG